MAEGVSRSARFPRPAQGAFRSRQLLTYREGATLVVNDPYLRQRVDVTCNERWFCWWSPVGERTFVDRHRTADAVDQIVEQYAGIYMEDRDGKGGSAGR